MIDFPASPTNGQAFTAAGVTWTWDGSKWLPSGLAPTVLGGINVELIGGALTMTYTLSEFQEMGVIRDEDGVRSFIPADPDNVDWQAYQAWLDEGNEPTPYTPPVAKET